MESLNGHHQGKQPPLFIPSEPPPPPFSLLNYYESPPSSFPRQKSSIQEFPAPLIAKAHQGATLATAHGERRPSKRQPGISRSVIIAQLLVPLQ